MTTTLEPLWADVHPTEHGRQRLGTLGLPATGTDVLARIEPDGLLVGDSDEVLYQLALSDVFAVQWHTTDDDPDALYRTFEIDPADCPSARLELWFDPASEGIEGLTPDQRYPFCYLYDWLCVQSNLCRLVSVPHYWVSAPAYVPDP
jgi:hypothetical protein